MRRSALAGAFFRAPSFLILSQFTSVFKMSKPRPIRSGPGWPSALRAQNPASMATSKLAWKSVSVAGTSLGWLGTAGAPAAAGSGATASGEATGWLALAWDAAPERACSGQGLFF